MKFKWKKIEIYEAFCEYLEKIDDEKEIFIYVWNKQTKEIRSLSQNNTFWKLFTDIWNHLWYTKEETHDILLMWVFWTKTLKLWKIEKEVALKPKTSELTKEEWKNFIDTILAFCKREDLPITITSKELRSLYESYNNT